MNLKSKKNNGYGYLRISNSWRLLYRTAVFWQIFLLLLLICLLLLSGCESIEPTREPEEDTEHIITKEEDEVYHIDPDILLSPTTNRVELEALMGSPFNIDLKKIENEHHPEITDTIFTYHYTGVMFVIYKAGYDEREFLVLVSITNENYRIGSLGAQISVGSTKEDVLLYFGEGGVWDNDTLTYYPLPEGDPLPQGMVYSFTFKNDKVVKIDIQADYF